MSVSELPRPEVRKQELRDALATVHARIRAAVERRPGGGPPPVLIVVTKNFPARDVELLAELGVRDVGENKDQEAAAKAQELAGLDLRWHFVGQLQTNKARSVARYAWSVQSVDRPGLVAALEKAMAGEQQRLTAEGRAERTPLRCHLQVNLAGSVVAGGGVTPAGRGGAQPADIPVLAEMVAAAPHLRLAGLMAVAPRGPEPSDAFDRLLRLSRELRAGFPEAVEVSAGMSGDLEAAVLAGATHLRVGSDVLGQRPPMR